MLRSNKSSLITPLGFTLLRGIDFEIPEGRLAYVHGPNGCGKTSLVKALLNLDFRLTEYQSKIEDYIYLPQLENKEFLLPIRIKDVSDEGFLLSEFERKVYWNQASGGQRKKALLERSLKEKTQLYVLDEPYNHLDDISIEKTNREIVKLIESGSTVIMVSHKAPKIEKELIVDLDVALWIS